MKIKSEKQSSKLHAHGAEDYSSPLRLDPEKYRKYLPETDWSEKVQDEWLTGLWNTMSEFVDLGFGTNSIQTPRNVRKSSKKNGKRRRI
jgi:hypothetical protein